VSRAWSAIALAGLLSLAMPAAAMTEQEASGNMMYFAFAMKEGEICERLGLPGLSALRQWEQKNGDALVRSLRRVEDYAAASGKVTREQAKDVALGLFVRHKDTYDREMAPGVTLKSCMRFGETLRLYETKLVRE
jgi:hypothetical protein